jgi:hypothetical protein
MDDPIYIGNGILDQIKIENSTYRKVITKKETFNTWMKMFEEFYEEYPYVVKWDYEKFIREILDYHD